MKRQLKVNERLEENDEAKSNEKRVSKALTKGKEEDEGGTR